MRDPEPVLHKRAQVCLMLLNYSMAIKHSQPLFKLRGSILSSAKTLLGSFLVSTLCSDWSVIRIGRGRLYDVEL